MDAWFCYHIVLMVVATISFILMWAAFGTPGWLAVTFQEKEAQSEWTVSSLNRSLFYDIHCPQELKTCMSCLAGDDSEQCVVDMNFPAYTDHYNWIKGLTRDTEEWVAWRVIMLIVVIFLTFGFVLVMSLVCCIFKTYVYHRIAAVAFGLWLLAGLIVWVPVAMIAYMHTEIEDTVNDDVAHDATLHVPYSVVLAAIAGFLALITALMLLWMTGLFARRDDKSSLSDTEDILSSNQKSTVIREHHHYYGPQPYYSPDRQLYYRDQDPNYVVRNGSASNGTDDFYQKQYLGPAQWGPNPWYDNGV